MTSALRKYKLIPLTLVLLALNAALFLVLPRYRFSSIVIHHSASEVDNYDSIKAVHQKRGWRDATYHLILNNGSTQVPLGYLEATSRYRFLAYSLATQSPIHNVTGVHLCVAGNYSEHEMPTGLRPALAHAVAALQERYHIPDSKILFHRNCSQSECPGTKLKQSDVRKWTKTLVQTCPPAIKRQQDEVLAGAVFSPYTISGWFLAVFLVFNGILVVFWLGGLAVSRRKPRKKGGSLYEIDGVALLTAMTGKKNHRNK